MIHLPRVAVDVHADPAQIVMRGERVWKGGAAFIPQGDVTKIRQLLTDSPVRDARCRAFNGSTIHRPSVKIETRSQEHLQAFGMPNMQSLESKLHSVGLCTTLSFSGAWLAHLQDLNRQKYVVCPSTWDSPGQIIVEAAIAGVLVFALPHRLNLQLLYPSFCMVSSMRELISKISFLEQHPEVYDALMAEVEKNLEHITMDESESPSNLLHLLATLKANADQPWKVLTLDAASKVL